MKRIFCLASLLLFLSAGLLSAQPWEDLFNGKNLKGWKQVTGTAKFQAKDGMIVGTSTDSKVNSFLATDLLLLSGHADLPFPRPCPLGDPRPCGR